MIRKLLFAGALSITALVGSGNVLADEIWTEQKLTADDGIAYDHFGLQVLVSGDTAIVSAPTPTPGAEPGKVYIYTRSGGTWTQTQKLTAEPGLTPPPNWPDFFGWSVALSGDTLLIGAPQAFNPMMGPVGAAYVFTRSGDTWTQQQELVTNDVQPSQWFGNAVGLVGDVAVVAGYNSDQIGAAYVFTRSGDTWTEEQKLSPSDGMPGQGQQFGRAIAFDGATLMIGASGPDFTTGTPPVGAVYVFEGSGSSWNEVQKLVASDGAQGDQFGFSIGLSGDTALISAAQAAVGGVSARGALYFFEYADDAWGEVQKLTDPDGEAHARFGYSVDLQEDVAIVGEWRRNSDPEGEQPPPKAGTVHLLQRAAGTWNIERAIVAEDGEPQDSFGWNVSLDDATVLIGATDGVSGNRAQGAAYAITTHPADYAVVEGAVQSLGHCGNTPAWLSGATVEIRPAAGDDAVVLTHGNGFYQVALPDDQGPVDITVTAPGHLPAVVGEVELISGVAVITDFELVLDAPCATAMPGTVSAELTPGQSTTRTVTVDNSQGTVDLEWSAGSVNVPAGSGGVAATGPAMGGATGVPGYIEAAGDPEMVATWDASTSDMLPTARGDVGECDDAPGLIYHDNGIVDNAYGVNPTVVDEAMFVDRFTPVAYPAPVSTVCLSFATNGQTSMEFEVVVYADDGEDGAPGTELGALAAVTEDFTPGAGGPPVWTRVDISALDITIESGSVYIGARWVPPDPNVFITADQAPPRPPGLAGGYFWTNVNDSWNPIVSQISSTYRALFVRAVTNPGGCHDPADIDWLSITPDAGLAPAGDGSEIELGFDATGLGVGTYTANLCIASDDPIRPLMIVPVEMTVVPENQIFSDRFEPGEM